MTDCPKWVKDGDPAVARERLLHPNKPTTVAPNQSSLQCQKRSVGGMDVECRFERLRKNCETAIEDLLSIKLGQQIRLCGRSFLAGR